MTPMAALRRRMAVILALLVASGVVGLAQGQTVSRVAAAEAGPLSPEVMARVDGSVA